MESPSASLLRSASMALRSALAIAVAIGAVVVGAVASAGAQDTSTHGTDTDMRILGATVTAPGVAERTMDATTADAFVRAWLGAGLFGTIPREDPPAGVVAQRVAVAIQTRTWKDQTLLVDYASDGETAWVSMPPQDLKWATGTGVWHRAPAGTIEAFEGRPAGASGRATAESPWDIPAGLIAGIAVTVVAAVLVIRWRARPRRRRRSAVPHRRAA